MKPKKAIAYLVIAFLVGIIISYGFYYLIIVDQIQQYEIQLEVSDHGGFNVATDKVYFSKIPPGSKGTRTLEIYGNEDRDVRVWFDVKGPIRPWIIVEDNDFVLPKNTTRIITIQAIVPKNATIGTNMTGLLKATFTRIW